MSNWSGGGRGDFHRNRVASEDGEETGEVPESSHNTNNMGGSNNPHHHGGGGSHYHSQGPPPSHHRPPSPVGSSHFRDNFRGGRGGGRFGGRGGRHRNRHGSFSGGPPQFHRGGDFRNENKIHRDTSFGSNTGPPPPIGHRESSFGSQGPPRGGGGGFRDGPFRDRDGGPPPLHHGRDAPPFARRGDAPGPMRDEFPPPRGVDRDMPMGGGPDIGIDRTRSTDSARDSPFVPGGSGIPREASFGQGGRGPPGFASRGPEGRDNPSHIHPHGPAHNRLENRPGHNVMNSPKPAGPPQPSRPTDPRRRASSSDVGALPQGGIAASMSGEGAAGLPSPRRHSYNDGPSSPSQPQRLNTYGSFGSHAPSAGGDTVIPRPGGGYRSPGGGIRRAISETAFPGEHKDFSGPLSGGPSKPWSPGDRSRSAPVAGKNESGIGYPPSHGRPMQQHERQQSTGSNVPGSSRMTGTRFQRTDGTSTETPVGGLPSIPETANTNDAVSSSTAMDPFGRARDWTHKSQEGVARSSSGGFKHASPSSIKSTRSPLSPPSGERSMLSAPKFPLASGGDMNEKESAKAKPEPLPPIPIAALGSAEKIQRAEVVIAHFNEVTSDTETTPNAAGNLPSKADIMAAVATIEKMIKETQKESEENEEAIGVAKKEERGKKAAEAAKLEEAEKKRRMELDKKLEERKKEEDKMKAELDLQAEGEAKVRFEAKKKELEEFFGGQLSKAKEAEKVRCIDDLQARITEASTGLEKGVARARRDLERSKNTAQKIGKKLAASETEYRALAESEEKKKKKKKKSAQKNSLQIEDVVKSITEENRTKAKEAHSFTFAVAEMGMHLGCHDEESATAQKFLEETKDPKYHKTLEEWSILTGQVTGLSDALYSEPSEAPFYEQIEKNHEVLGPLVKEFIRDKQNRLDKHWTELAEEYEVRKRLYEKQQRKLAEKARGSVAVTSRPSIIGNNKETKENPEEKPSEPAARSSNNPYRRARRGNEVRSEYEQEQIIAEIAAKEAMDKKITHGGSKIPRQIVPLERDLTATYIHTFTSQRVDDPELEAQEESFTNVWTDMEKCIFLDRFLQFPKDFRRIASFLRNKTTKDCIAFYYDSKQTVPYKGALKEHMMRRKRKGDYQVWDASIQAVTSVGGTVSAGEDEEKPVIFGVPGSDLTFKTRLLHPLKRDVLDRMVIDEAAAAEYEDTGDTDDRWKSRKRGRDPLFILDKEQTKFLRQSSQEAMTNTKPDDTEDMNAKEESKPSEGDTPAKKSVHKQKWTATEKKLFAETVEKYGKDWSMLAKAVTTKSLPQIKNYFYDYKKQNEKKTMKADKKAAKTFVKEEKAKRTEQAFLKKRKSPTLETSTPNPPTPPPSAEPATSFLQYDDSTTINITEDMLNDLNIQQRLQLEILQRNQTLQREQEIQELQRQAQLERNGEQYGEADVHAQADLNAPQAQAELLERLLSGSQDYSRDIIQQLILQSRQQAQQQQQRHQSIDLTLQHHQRQQQHQSPALQPQSALHQLLSRQHHQREQQQQQQASQLEEARRLIEQQSQQQQALSSIFPGLASSSHLFQPQQSRLSQLAAALQQQDSSSGLGISDLTDAANIQRLLQMQQQQQQQQRQNNPFLSLSQNHSQLGSLLGLSSSAGSDMSANLLALQGLGANRNAPAQAEHARDDLTALLSRYGNAGQLGGGATTQSHRLGGAASHLFQGGNSTGIATPDNTPSVSDALQMLQRAIQNRNPSHHGFGSPGGN